MTVMLRIYFGRPSKEKLRAEAFATEEGKLIEANLKGLEAELVEAIRQRDQVWADAMKNAIPARHPYWSSPELTRLRNINDEMHVLRRRTDALGELTYAVNHQVEAISDSREPVEIPLPSNPEGLAEALMKAVDQVNRLKSLHGEVEFFLDVE